MNGLTKKSGTRRKDKFNPSSRNLPEKKEKAIFEEDCLKACYAPKQSQDALLRKLAENARNALQKKLDWERKCYGDIVKIVGIVFLVIGLIIGVIIGGVLF